MDHDEHGLRPTEVEDPNTGQRYLMYTLPIAGWPGAPRIVYECSVCHGRFPPHEWTSGCPGCAESAGGGGRKRKRKKR